MCCNDNEQWQFCSTVISNIIIATHCGLLQCHNNARDIFNIMLNGNDLSTIQPTPIRIHYIDNRKKQYLVTGGNHRLDNVKSMGKNYCAALSKILP